MPVVDEESKSKLELNAQEQQIVATIEAHVKELADRLTDEEKKAVFINHQLMYEKNVLEHNIIQMTFRVGIIEKIKNKMILNYAENFDEDLLYIKPFASLMRIKNSDDDRDLEFHELLNIRYGSVVDNTGIVVNLLKYISKINENIVSALMLMLDCDENISCCRDAMQALQNYEFIKEHFEFKYRNKYYFDFNDQMQLLKISRQSGIRFSIIYLDDQNKLLLDSREKRHLGSGGYSNVKKAVIANSQELRAVKIQKETGYISEHIVEQETNNLRSLYMFYGKAYRPVAKKYYTVMELVPGQDMHFLIKTKQYCKVSVGKMFLRAAEEIQKLHDNNKIHLDIKLENIMYDVKEDKCRIIDYSFMTTINGDETIVKSYRVGTECYFPPEIKFNKPDNQYFYSKRTDIFAFGANVLRAEDYVHGEFVAAAKKLIINDVEKRPLDLKDFIATAQKFLQGHERFNKKVKSSLS